MDAYANISNSSESHENSKYNQRSTAGSYNIDPSVLVHCYKDIKFILRSYYYSFTTWYMYYYFGESFVVLFVFCVTVKFALK